MVKEMIEIIPAIDLIEGKCVRLEKGDFEKQIEYGDPLEIAKYYAENGIKRLHLVDLDGAKLGSPQNLKILEAIASSTQLKIDFSGGIRNSSDLANIFSAGASYVTIGSIAVNSPNDFYKWLRNFGNEKIILAADFKGEFITYSGWQKNSICKLYDFLREYYEKGGLYVLSTDVSRDGMMSGTATETYKKMKEKFPQLNIIASGGIRTIDDIKELSGIGIYGVVVGKALLSGQIKISDLNAI